MASAMQKGFRESFDEQKNRPFLVHENTGRYRPNRPRLRYCEIVIFQGFPGRNLALARTTKRGQKQPGFWGWGTGPICSKKSAGNARRMLALDTTGARP